MNPSGLAGDPPDPRDLPSGCPFHPRCPDVRPVCPRAAVELWAAGSAHVAACHAVHEPARVEAAEAQARAEAAEAPEAQARAAEAEARAAEA
jgi:peptide/nickel transport system ATP-binding protein